MPTENIVPPGDPAEPPRPFDLTILTVLRGGRHLFYSTLIREGDDPRIISAGHCAIRRLYHVAVERFVIAAGEVAHVVTSEEVR